MSMLDFDTPPCIGERFVDVLHDLQHRAGPSLSERRDVRNIAACIATHARGLGCDSSNTAGAIAYGLRHGGDTLACIRLGKARAALLAARQRASTPLDAA